MRENIIFECTTCHNRLYTSTKNKKLKQGRLELKKFCRFCRKHINHKEVK
ncbi:50S ribosomal protein L33 [Candidatus Omnitrophota bacterium]